MYKNGTMLKLIKLMILLHLRWFNLVWFRVKYYSQRGSKLIATTLCALLSATCSF